MEVAYQLQLTGPGEPQALQEVLRGVGSLVHRPLRTCRRNFPASGRMRVACLAVQTGNQLEGVSQAAEQASAA